jgi:hypothetical protein
MALPCKQSAAFQALCRFMTWQVYHGPFGHFSFSRTSGGAPPGPAAETRFGHLPNDWPDEAARRILANIAAAGGSGARLMMIEFVVPPGDTRTCPR